MLAYYYYALFSATRHVAVKMLRACTALWHILVENKTRKDDLILHVEHPDPSGLTKNKIKLALSTLPLSSANGATWLFRNSNQYMREALFVTLDLLVLCVWEADRALLEIDYE